MGDCRPGEPPVCPACAAAGLNGHGDACRAAGLLRIAMAVNCTKLDLVEPESPTLPQAVKADLFVDAEVYRYRVELRRDSSESFKALLDFVVKLPNFAPFNAMLLQVQKPGLSYAASTYEWQELFGRKPKENARPLLILWPFGPIALVYDVCDTEGEDLPEDVMSFLARDKSGGKNWTEFETRLKRKGIRLQWFDGGDRKAGYIRRIDPWYRVAQPREEVPRRPLVQSGRVRDRVGVGRCRHGTGRLP